MDLQMLPDDEDIVRRFVEGLWLPYHRSLEATVKGHALASDADLVAEVVGFHLERLRSDDHRTWVAIDARSIEDADVEDEVSDLAGFVSTGVAPCPSVFDRPDRVTIDDLFVLEPYRGSGLSRVLVRVAVEHARELGRDEVALDVHVENERATGFYERLGFEPFRRRMVLDVGEFG